MTTIYIPGAFISNYTIQGLLPYTQYKLNIAGYSANGRGPLSDDRTFTTLESAPTPPRNFAFHNVTNSSVVLTWEPPEFVNGGLIKYEVWSNSNCIEVRKPDNALENMTYTLSGLESDKIYEIVVVACTKTCSNRSNTVDIRTDIGRPGMATKNLNSTRNVFKWHAPATRGGSLDYYELKSIFGDTRTVYINGTTCTLLIQVCDGPSDEHIFSVRAVNVLYTPHRSKRNALLDNDKRLPTIDERIVRSRRDIHLYQKICAEEDDTILTRITAKDKHAIFYRGDWFEIEKNHCRFQSTSLISVYVILSIFASMSMGYAVFLIMKKIRKMKDIGVKLPEGLEGIIQDNGKGTNGVNLNCNIGRMTTSGSTGGDANRSDNLFISREQEQSLLKKNRSESGSTSSSIENNSDHCEDNEAVDSESEVILIFFIFK